METPRRPRVLIIDDNLTQLDLYALMMENDFAVLTATRGESGYDVARIERPDAIVVDVLLPDVDGLTICQRLLDHPSTASIPLVVLTGDEASFSRARAMGGLDAALRKPCPGDELLRVLRNAIAVRAIQ